MHTERLFILWFLNAFDYSEEDIINIFSSLPDFNREKTEYQVKYAIKKGYYPYSCNTLRSYDLCYANEDKKEICTKGYYSRMEEEQKFISNPRDYVRISQYRDSKNKEIKSKEIPYITC